jgi:hypothetical protein
VTTSGIAVKANALLTAALGYLDRGWQIVPLRPGQKAPPLVKDWPQLHPDAGAVQQWWAQWPDANVGIAFGHATGLIALDIDGLEGERYLDQLSGRDLPATLEFTTPRGRRYLYRTPEGVEVKNRQWRAGDHEEVRLLAEGRYTVAPPSRLEDGGEYRWEEGRGPGEIEPAPCPRWLVDLLTREGPPPDRPPSARPDDQEEGSVINRARDYLRQCDPAISGQGGHNQTFKVAVKLVKGFGLDEPTALALLEEEYNPRCQPPWTLKELEHKVRDAARQDNPEGFLRDEPRNPLSADNGDGARLLSVHDIAGVADLIAGGAALRWHWPGWLQRGVVNLLFGPAGVGKTRVIADLIRRVRHGLPWPDGTPMTLDPGALFMWVLADFQHDEIATLCQHFGIVEAVKLNATPDDLYGGTSIDTPADLKALEERLAVVRPAWLIVDTVGNSTDKNLCTQEEAKQFYQPLQNLAARYDCGVIAVTHVNAAGSVLGRRGLEKVRVAIKLTRPDDEDDRLRLEVIKSNSKYPPPLGVRPGTDGYEYDTNPPRDRAGPDRPAKVSKVDEAADWLADRLSGGPQQVGRLRTAGEAAGFSAKSLYRAKEKLMVREDEIDGRMWWLPPEADPGAA